MSGDKRRAAQAVQALEPAGVLATIHNGGVLSLMMADGIVARIFPQPLTGQAAHQPTFCELVHVIGEQRQVLATGTMSEMDAFRDELADRLVRRSAGRGVSNYWLAGVFGLGLLAGASAIGTLHHKEGNTFAAGLQAMLAARHGLPSPSGMPPILQPGWDEAPPSRPMLPPSIVRASPPPEAPARVVRRGEAVRPAAPVPLDDPAAAPSTPPTPSGRPAGFSVTPPVTAPAAPPPPPSQAAPLEQRSEAPPVEERPLALASQEAAPAPAPASAGDVANLSVTSAQMRAMEQARDILKGGGLIPGDLLAAMPQQVAASIIASGKVAPAAPGTGAPVLNSQLPQPPQAAPEPVVAAPNSPQEAPMAVRDRFGVSTVPDPNSWAALGSVRLPLPGGGDITTPDDMRRFGFAPVERPSGR